MGSDGITAAAHREQAHSSATCIPEGALKMVVVVLRAAPHCVCPSHKHNLTALPSLSRCLLHLPSFQYCQDQADSMYGTSQCSHRWAAPAQSWHHRPPAACVRWQHQPARQPAAQTHPAACTPPCHVRSQTAGSGSAQGQPGDQKQQRCEHTWRPAVCTRRAQGSNPPRSLCCCQRGCWQDLCLRCCCLRQRGCPGARPCLPARRQCCCHCGGCRCCWRRCC